MTRKEEQEIIEKLKAAKAVYDQRFAPSKEAIEKSRVRLMSYMESHGGKQKTAMTGIGRLIDMARFAKYVTPPAFAYGMALFVLLAIPASAAYLSQNSLPGQSLYQAKILTEQAQVRFISNPATRASKQMENAGNRLEEAKTLSLQNPEAGDEVTSQAIVRFTEEVKTAKATLKEAGDPEQVTNANKIIAEKASQYRQTIEETKKALAASVTPVEADKTQETPVALPITFPVDPGKRVAPMMSAPKIPLATKPSRPVALAALDEAEKALDEVVTSDEHEGLKDGEVGL